MTLNDLEHLNRGFYGFYICSQWAFIHALLSRVPFALAGLSCSHGKIIVGLSKVFCFRFLSFSELVCIQAWNYSNGAGVPMITAACSSPVVWTPSRKRKTRKKTTSLTSAQTIEHETCSDSASRSVLRRPILYERQPLQYHLSVLYTLSTHDNTKSFTYFPQSSFTRRSPQKQMKNTAANTVYTTNIQKSYSID